jgi:nucleotide-binding universal stress UspA family protein
MTETYHNTMILACIDGSEFTESVCQYASWMAKVLNSPLKLLHTIEHPKTAAVSDLTGAIGLGASEELLKELTDVEQARAQLLIKKGNAMLQSAKQKAVAMGVSEVQTRQRHGSLAETLVELEQQIRVLVLGIHGEHHAEDQAGIGAQLETIIRALHKPILVVNTAFSEPQNIMLAYDGSDACHRALELIAEGPLFKTMTCHLVHVSDEARDAEQLLKPAAETLIESGIQVITAHLSGQVEQALANYQAEQNIDLTLMGAFSHNRFRDFLLGSFTAKMLSETQKPLFLLR